MSTNLEKICHSASQEFQAQTLIRTTAVRSVLRWHTIKYREKKAWINRVPFCKEKLILRIWKLPIHFLGQRRLEIKLVDNQSIMKLMTD